MIFWSERIGNELYIYCNGELIYKRWYDAANKPKSGILFNKGWLPERLSEK